jgi:hypothetical protein
VPLAPSLPPTHAGLRIFASRWCSGLRARAVDRRAQALVDGAPASSVLKTLQTQTTTSTTSSEKSTVPLQPARGGDGSGEFQPDCVDASDRVVI